MKKFWLSFLMLTTMPAWAVLPFGATPAEMVMCQARVYSRLDRSDPGSVHMHHYCDGLRFMDRAYASMRNKADMKYYLQEAIGGFDYVLGKTQESYSMRGEVHLGKARALKLAGRNAEAVAEFNKALSYKADSPEIYRALADHYYDTGNKQKAMDLVIEGLQRNPNSKGLKRRYSEFGGKLPYPVAVEKSVVAEEPKVEAKPVETEPPSGAVETVAPTGPVPDIVAPKIGSPDNPYCRFCP